MGQVIFDPLLAWALLGAAALVMVGFVALSLWRRQSGWWLRGLGALVLLVAIANPSLQSEDRENLSDIVLMVVDRSASQRISDRPDQTEAAAAEIARRVEALGNTEVRTLTVGDAEGNGGTELMAGLAELMAETPRARIAGAIAVTDGQVHDMERAPDLPAPFHVLLTGRDADWDRRLVVTNAPAFAIIGEQVTLTLRIEDQGQVPPALAGLSVLEIAVDGGPPQSYDLPTGRDIELPVTLNHGGLNVIQFTVPEAPGELTDRNNTAVVQINGVRDRLRVLLVSGEPHPGERTWRNLLKSDSSVDLVHFTILRPPEKQDGVPVTELSLIAFPTRELFLEKIDEFDLIIFDRYRRRGILPSIYLDNVRQYVLDGGAVLVAAGPDFATADSLYRSPLSEVLPAAPSSRVIEEGFLPAITDLGHRHPVTEGLAQFSPTPGTEEDPGWGRWFRLIDLIDPVGQTVMEAQEGRPLLVLDRVGEGRVALLGSDHAWLWSRGFEGGGPQLELLRRLAHWMMGEPELEEEALSVTATGQTMTVTRRTLAEEVGQLEITHPDGTVTKLTLEEASPGRFTGVYTGPDIGLYRLTDGLQEAVIALGPAAPREFEQTIADGTPLRPVVETRDGGILPIEAGLPTLREIRPGRVAAGRGWIGITRRDAYLTTDVTVTPFLPAWLYLLLASGLVVGAWLREGRS